MLMNIGKKVKDVLLESDKYNTDHLLNQICLC